MSAVRRGSTGASLVDLRDAVAAEVGAVVAGQAEALDLMLAALVVGGHVLLEGPPGVAKTLLASAMARASGLDFRRAQFTPDMLPSDLTGTVILRGASATFRPGPVFTQVLLADEVNRTPPKTQAALLEAMQEGHVTVEGSTHPLPDPFLVLATQNPIEFEGTYPLPEAQLDRFFVRARMTYPTDEDEVRLLQMQQRGAAGPDVGRLKSVVSADQCLAVRAEVQSTKVSDEVVRYVAAVTRCTRTLPSIALGASPRAGAHLLAGARAWARLQGRDFATPDDVVELAPSVLAHRLILRPEAELEGYDAEQAVAAAVAAVPVPR
ncbi:MAG TPA: MoxR family ATPase [Acidimicrobiales bacterium]|nr:MoxR family ATPase [Acidimicrobiales bacterium]